MDNVHCSSRLTWQREGFGCAFFQIRCVLPSKVKDMKKGGGGVEREKTKESHLILFKEGVWRKMENKHS